MIGPFVVLAMALYFSPASGVAKETVGEKFRNVIADIDSRCKREKRGPYLDRKDPEYRKKIADTSCDILKLQPRDWREVKMAKVDSQPYPVPEHWLSTPEGKFAHSIKLPTPNDKPKAVYTAGMTGDEYFQTLCREDAGDFVRRRVSDVRGLRQDRPWIPLPHGYRDVIFWAIEKGGLHDAQDYLVQPPAGGYRFLEVRLSEVDAKKSGAPFRIFYRDEEGPAKKDFIANIGDGKFVRVPYVVATDLRRASEASYGYTWRGVWPTGGVEQGIEGYELIAYQVEPLEVIGYQREFWRHLPDDSQGDPRITHTSACSQKRPMMSAYRFLQHVLLPSSRP